MQIKSDFTIQKVGGSYVAVPVGDASIHFHAMIRLNETGALLWKQMAERDCTEEDLINCLLAEYDVDRAIAEADVRRLVQQLRDHNILL